MKKAILIIAAAALIALSLLAGGCEPMLEEYQTLLDVQATVKGMIDSGKLNCVTICFFQSEFWIIPHHTAPRPKSVARSRRFSVAALQS